MSLFSRMFGQSGGAGGKGGSSGGAPKGALSVPEAVQKADEHIRLLQAKVSHIEDRRKKEYVEAKKVAGVGGKNKAKALPHLKRMKLLEKQMMQIQGQIDNLEAQKFALESAGITNESAALMAGMRDSMLKTGLNYDKIADTLDDVRETMQDFEQVNDLLSQPMMSMQYDDEELMGEFDTMLNDEAEEAFNEDAAAVELPDVPTTALPQPTPAAKSKEQDEMAELAAWAN